MEMTSDSRSLDDLIRRQTLEKAAIDLRRAADALDELSAIQWPVPDRDVENARANVALVRASLAVVDQVGWPSGID